MDKILILDFGSQVTQLIARRVREAGVYCEIQPTIAPMSKSAPTPQRVSFCPVAPCSTLDEGSPRAAKAVFEMGIPVLAICYGQQTTCLQLGGKVEGGHEP